VSEASKLPRGGPPVSRGEDVWQSLGFPFLAAEFEQDFLVL
jgi:hypothetical protein